MLVYLSTCMRLHNLITDRHLHSLLISASLDYSLTMMSFLNRMIRSPRMEYPTMIFHEEEESNNQVIKKMLSF